MDYYESVRSGQVRRERYGDSPMRGDFVPKGPPKSPMVSVKKKEQCPPRFVTKIEGSAVEEGCKVFFEGIVDGQPFPSFSWFFNDQPIFPGQKGFEDAEVHNSRKMSTLILNYAREQHMGKFTLVSSNPLGSAESCCDLIVRKKQFPPVFWKRLYNVVGEDRRRFVGDVEVGGWPVPAVYWYKVLEDGTEEEVRTKTHTENWNGNPNKYVPSRKVEIRQIDQIRHCIIFLEGSDGDSGLYRVRAVNCLGEAECEAELMFDGSEEMGDLYLPPLWKEKKRLTWKDEDQRKKPFWGLKDTSPTNEELADMKMNVRGKPLSRITEYLATLPDYIPSDQFRNMTFIPFRSGVEEKLKKPDRRGGNAGSFPSRFHKGNIIHHGYITDTTGRILPRWQNLADPRSTDSSDWAWNSVQPHLFIPDIHKKSRSPTPTPVWETDENINSLVAWLRRNAEENDDEMRRHQDFKISKKKEKDRINHGKYLPTNNGFKPEELSEETESNLRTDCKRNWTKKLEGNITGAQTNAAQFTDQFIRSMNNVDVYLPDLPVKESIGVLKDCSAMKDNNNDKESKTWSMNVSSSENTEGNLRQITFQQEILGKSIEEKTDGHEIVKHAGVKVLPTSPMIVRKMSEEELPKEAKVYVKDTSIHDQLETTLSSETRKEAIENKIFKTENSVATISSQHKIMTDDLSKDELLTGKKDDYHVFETFHSQERLAYNSKERIDVNMDKVKYSDTQRTTQNSCSPSAFKQDSNDIFTTKSCPNTPMNRRRITSMSPSSVSQQYREAPSGPFQPGFYRKPPSDSTKPHFSFVKRQNSRSNLFCEK